MWFRVIVTWHLRLWNFNVLWKTPTVFFCLFLPWMRLFYVINVLSYFGVNPQRDTSLRVHGMGKIFQNSTQKIRLCARLKWQGLSRWDVWWQKISKRYPKEGGHVCIHIADPLHCSAATNTPL